MGKQLPANYLTILEVVITYCYDPGGVGTLGMLAAPEAAAAVVVV